MHENTHFVLFGNKTKTLVFWELKQTYFHCFLPDKSYICCIDLPTLY